MTDSTFDYDDGGIDTNHSGNQHLNDLIAQRYSRRQTLRGGLTAMTTAVFGGVLLAGCDDDNDLLTRESVTVTAGNSATASAGKTVTLQGTASASALTVGWTQVSGPSVTLNNANTATASFTAPAVGAATPLVFRFTGTTGVGDTATADTTVTVSPATLDFTAVAKNRNDVVTVPAGYAVTVLYRLGDPINGATPAYANDGSDTGVAARAARRARAVAAHRLPPHADVRGGPRGGGEALRETTKALQRRSTHAQHERLELGGRRWQQRLVRQRGGVRARPHGGV